MEEVIDLDTTDDFNMDKPSVNFGGGIELLMNNKNSASSASNDINLDKELEELNEIENEEIHIGKNTVNMEIPKSAPFEFKKMDDIHIEEEMKNVEQKSKQDILREKFSYLRKLEQLESKGVTLSKQYSMESSLDEMKGEYENIIAEKERTNSIKFQGKVLTTFITGLEYLNNKVDPFDIKLDGWSEQINENIEDYDDIFSELHEKYKSKAKMAPELKLLFQLASSGMMIHMTNTMFKSAMPGMDDIMRQNPDLMNQFTKAAVNSMENTNPGLSNFMNDFGMSHSQDQPPSGPSNIREEMRGPENINEVLNQFNKKIDIPEKPNIPEKVDITKNDSTISIEDLDNLSQASAPSVSSRRRRKNDKNAINLAI